MKHHREYLPVVCFGMTAKILLCDCYTKVLRVGGKFQDL